MICKDKTIFFDLFILASYFYKWKTTEEKEDKPKGKNNQQKPKIEKTDRQIKAEVNFLKIKLIF